MKVIVYIIISTMSFLSSYACYKKDSDSCYNQRLLCVRIAAPGCLTSSALKGWLFFNQTSTGTSCSTAFCNTCTPISNDLCNSPFGQLEIGLSWATTAFCLADTLQLSCAIAPCITEDRIQKICCRGSASKPHVMSYTPLN